ncbi:MAG: hypothetical protein M0R05_03705 [Bacilli bacterium]|nr:hypothetical protein [Bacilli bacterium]
MNCNGYYLDVKWRIKNSMPIYFNLVVVFNSRRQNIHSDIAAVAIRKANTVE